jgi:hypothetical protein
MTPEFWAIIAVGVAITGVGVSGLGLGFLAYRGLHSDIADLRERMAKLEGAMDGFTKGRIAREVRFVAGGDTP